LPTADATKVEKDKKDQKKSMTGLTVMHQYLKEGENTTTLPLQRSASAASLGSKGYDAAAPGSETEAVTMTRALPTSLELGTDERPVAEVYVGRAMQGRNLTMKQLQEEVMRRRRHLWIGGGEGIRNVRAAIMNRPQDLRLDRKTRQGAGQRSPRSDDSGSSPRSARSGEAGAQTGRSARSVGSSPRGYESPMRSASPSPGPTPRRSTTGKLTQTSLAEQPGRGHDDEVDTNFPIMPWTTKEKRIRGAEMAMMIASGQPIDKIGLLGDSERHEELGRICRRLFQEYRLNSGITDDLCDLQTLVRFKCARSWLPPLILVLEEMENTADEQRASFHDRRSVYKDGMKFCLQICERIMFSLTEFLLLQEEGFDAMWTLEDSTAVPPCSKRFLPHRPGDLDADARTPRDDDDAEALAPCEATETSSLEIAAVTNTKSASLADFNEASGAATGTMGESLAMLPSQGTMPLGRSPRLDRNLVRLRKGKLDAKNNEKLHDAVVQAQHEAVAGGTSLFFD